MTNPPSSEPSSQRSDPASSSHPAPTTSQEDRKEVEVMGELLAPKKKVISSRPQPQGNVPGNSGVPGTITARRMISSVEFIPARPAEGEPVERPKYISVLLIGPIGSTKTSFAVSLPGRTHVIDVDHKMDQMIDSRYVDLSRVTYQQYATSLTGTKKLFFATSPNLKKLDEGFIPNMRPVVAEKVFDTINGLYDLADMNQGNLPFDNLVIDSISRYSEHLKTYVVWKHRHAHPNQHDWDAILENWRRLLNGLSGLPCNLVVTCHEKMEYIEGISGTVELKYVPAIQGQFGQNLGGYFQEVYYMRPEKAKGGKMIVRLLTRSDSQHAARSTLTEIVKVPANFEKILAGEYRGEKGDEYMARLAAKKEVQAGGKKVEQKGDAGKRIGEIQTDGQQEGE